MGKLSFEQYSAAAGAPAVRAKHVGPHAARAWLLAGVGVGAALGVVVTVALAEQNLRDPGLTRLLHFMVGVKALIFAAVSALVFRRLAGAVGPRVLAGYGASLGVSAAALAWLWSLSAVFPGSVLFYSGLGACFVIASHDPLLLDGFRARRGA